jgi:adenylosuccinate synthase
MGGEQMRSGQVVIGANYGDEGKGLMTDYFASQDPDHSAVVRFNGGAQAGHTVIAPDGRRHVFSHFGSGSFVHCPTYLSQFFIVNPLLFAKEYEELHTLGVDPIVYIDHKAFVTTPYDMFINQTLERQRGTARHGSCGMGINETVTRCLRSTWFAVRAYELLDPNTLFEKLLDLGETWFPARLKEHGIETDSRALDSFAKKREQIMHQFVSDVSRLLAVATITCEYPKHQRIIFEGAQGLLLDEDRLDQWPHVTRSKTGLFNVLHLAKKFQLDELDVSYVSRTYLTRHGAGPLTGESDWSFSDQTNVSNQFQGHLRFAPMDWNQLRNSIDLDLKRARFFGLKVNANMAMTCLDQEPISKRANLHLPLKYTSCGASRTDVKVHALVRS